MPELCHEFQFTLQDILLHCVVLSPERVATVVGNCISETATQCFNFHQVARQSAALVVKTLHTWLVFFFMWWPQSTVHLWKWALYVSYTYPNHVKSTKIACVFSMPSASTFISTPYYVAAHFDQSIVCYIVVLYFAAFNYSIAACATGLLESLTSADLLCLWSNNCRWLERLVSVVVHCHSKVCDLVQQSIV